MHIVSGKMALVLSLLFLLCSCGSSAEEITSFRLAEAEPEDEVLSAAEDTAALTQVPAEIVVYVCGAVEHPGVYHLPKDARAGDAVEQAGGLTKKADAKAVNLARLLADGEQLLVPEVSAETEGTVLATSPGLTADGKVNINSADVTQLQGLSGIGEVRAQAIITYRETHGAFSDIADIKQVDGIGDALFQKIKDEISTG